MENNFTQEFLKEYKNDHVFQVVLHYLDRDISPYWVIENLIRKIKNDNDLYKKAIEEITPSYIITDKETFDSLKNNKNGNN